jgi:hypothetical protein
VACDRAGVRAVSDGRGQFFPQLRKYDVQPIGFRGASATRHKLGHAFGLNHDFRNDNNFLMGNGFRGLRASYFPQQFSSDDIQLSCVAAETLNVNRYFNRNQTFTDNVAPNVILTTAAGSATPVSGQLQVSFQASDTARLALAWLMWNGKVIGHTALSGTNQTFTFNTPFYTAGTTDTFSVMVYDSQGNRTQRDVSRMSA